MDKRADVDQADKFENLRVKFRQLIPSGVIIPDHHKLYRRIPYRDYEINNPNSNYISARTTFIDRQKMAISCDWCIFSTPEESKQRETRGAPYGVISLRLADIRKISITPKKPEYIPKEFDCDNPLNVKWEPYPEFDHENEAHSGIYGVYFKKLPQSEKNKLRIQLAKISRWEIKFEE